MLALAVTMVWRSVRLYHFVYWPAHHCLLADDNAKIDWNELMLMILARENDNPNPADSRDDLDDVPEVWVPDDQ